MAILLNILFGILGICAAYYAYNETNSKYPELVATVVCVIWALAQIGCNYLFK